MRAVSARRVPVLMAALLALTASLFSGLSPLSAGVSAAALFLLGTPVLAALQERLQSLPALLGAAGLILLVLLGILG